MRSGLTELQTNILNASVKNRFFLFEVTLSGSVTPDYYWSDQAKFYGGHDYTFKIMKDGLSPITLNMGSPESKVIPPCEVTVQVSFSGSIIDGHYASAFEGASVTIRLVCGAYLEPVPAPGDTDEVVATPDYQETEIMAWRFKVLSSSSVDQVMTWKMQDFFTIQLDKEYPNTPLVSDLFRFKNAKDDNACVPITFGSPYFPHRWIPSVQTATYSDADTFTVTGDQTALFAAGQFLMASCGVDGAKGCWVSSSSFGSGVTTVNLTAGSDDLTSNLTTVQIDGYLLGVSTETYSINRARSPREAAGTSVFLPANYTFDQDTVTGSDAQTYKMVQLICTDADKDGTNDSNGLWNPETPYDLPIKVSGSNSALTDPAEIAEFIFEAWGIPSVEIDDVSKAAATAIFSTRGLSFDIAIWYRQKREELISKLFSLAGMVPVIRDTVGFKVLSTTSQLTIEEDLVKPGSFSISKVGYSQSSDSGYVTWKSSTEPVDQVNKSLIAAKSTTTNKSDITIEADWILDSVKAQKAGKLALQRALLRDKTITFTAQGKILQLEPGDMITINPANFGKEGAAYDCMITKMTIHDGLWVDVECTRFSDSLDSWDDLTATEITPADADTSKAYSPIYQGQVDASGAAGTASNEITQTVLIGMGGILVTNADPATNGGFKATNSELTCYNASGAIRFHADYSGGATDGNITMGNYSGGQGAKWNQATGLFDVAGAIAATSGTIAGWNIGAASISKINTNAGLAMNSTIPAVVCTDGNNYERVRLGFDGTNYGLTVKDEANKTIININDLDKNISGWMIDEEKLYNANSYISSASFISFGTTPPQTYGDNVGAFLGYLGGEVNGPRLSLYKDANHYFKWEDKPLIKSDYFSLAADGKLTVTEASISGTLNANDIVSGIISARTFQTAGSRLTAATTAGDGTVYVADTSLFPASGTAWIYDTIVRTFTYTSKSANALLGCSGVLTHSSGLVVGGEFKRMIVSSTDNEMHFYGLSNGVDIEELCSIGLKTVGADTMIGVFGTADSTHTALYGRSKNNYGVAGLSVEGNGVYGFSSSGYGGKFYTDENFSGKSPLLIVPSESSSSPAHVAEKGSVWVTDDGIPYHNTDGSTGWHRTVLACLSGSFVWNPSSVADGAGGTHYETVTGAALGDAVIIFPPYDLQGVIITGYVSDTNEVAVRLQNETGDTKDLGEGTWGYMILRR